MKRRSLLAALLLGACAWQPHARLVTAPEAAHWRPFVLGTAPRDLPGPPGPGTPAEAADEAAVQRWAKRRTAADLAAIAYWDGGAPAWHFDAETRALANTALLPTVAAARALAAVHVAMADAAVAAWQLADGTGRVPPVTALPGLVTAPGLAPDPSWPCAHAAVATAAALVLGHLFPEAADGLESKAKAIGLGRVAAGAAFPSDVTAGEGVGRAAALAVIARLDAMGDGAGPLPHRAGGFAEADPELPAAGGWAHWLPGTVAEPAAPAATPGAALAEVVAANHRLDIRARNIADRWLAVEPAAYWSEKAAHMAADHQLDLPHATRLMAYVAEASADAATTSWKLQYQVLWPRPAAPGLETVRFAPAHPAWPDDGAAVAGAASTVLAAAFPAEAAALARDAAEAAEAGFDGAQHYRADGLDGLALGRSVGTGAVRRMHADGAAP